MVLKSGWPPLIVPPSPMTAVALFGFLRVSMDGAGLREVLNLGIDVAIAWSAKDAGTSTGGRGVTAKGWWSSKQCNQVVNIDADGHWL